MTEVERRKYFDEVYAQFDRRVFAYCVYVLSDRDKASDVYQEVFIKVYQALHTVRDQDRIAHWIFRIARNECLNAMKSNQRSENRSVRMDESDPIPDANATAAYNDEIEYLHWGLSQIGKEYREALVLAEFEGFSLKEIAEMTGASLSNVKIRVHRAKQKLHALLQPILNDYE
jgi:RNA polymerase sigma-70 factor, ECF subfamily